MMAAVRENGLRARPCWSLLASLLLLGAWPLAWAGAWGAGAFDNDDALDWISDLESSGDPRAITRALEPVDAKKAYIEAPVCSVAIAAAEVMASVRGKPAAALPREARQWIVRTGFRPSRELLGRARDAVTTCRNGKNSELRQLWLEGKSRGWFDETARLLERLE